MDPLIQSGVDFNSEEHTYRLGEKSLQGITTMIGQMLFPGYYDNVPFHILENARIRGQEIHAEISEYELDGVVPFSIEGGHYVALREAEKLNIVASEYIVTDRQVFASPIDLVSYRDGVYDLIDVKTTYVLNIPYLEWQLSIYAYLFEMQNPGQKVGRLCGLHIKSSGAELIEVKRHPNSMVLHLMNLYLTHGTCDRSIFLPNLERREWLPADLQKMEDYFIDLKRDRDRTEAEYEEMRAKVYARMSASGVDVFETTRLTFRKTKETQRTTFDLKRFKVEHPDLYKKYTAKTPSKGSVKLTINDD